MNFISKIADFELNTRTREKFLSRFWGSNNFSQKYFPRVGHMIVNLGQISVHFELILTGNGLKCRKIMFFQLFGDNWL